MIFISVFRLDQVISIFDLLLLCHNWSVHSVRHASEIVDAIIWASTPTLDSISRRCIRKQKPTLLYEKSRRTCKQSKRPYHIRFLLHRSAAYYSNQLQEAPCQHALLGSCRRPPWGQSHHGLHARSRTSFFVLPASCSIPRILLSSRRRLQEAYHRCLTLNSLSSSLSSLSTQSVQGN